MKRLSLALMVLALAVAGCSDTSEPLPAGSDNFPTVPEAVAEVEETVPTTTKAATTCDVVREALLTGSQADIDASMAALKADKTADATAREYADYYLGRDRNDPQNRQADVSLIRMSCS